MTTLRPYHPDDLPAALALNTSEHPHVGLVDDARLAHVVSQCVQATVADDAGELGGLLLVMGPGADYDSLNYRWFSERYDNFWYVDRVVVAPTHRRQGIGSMLYGYLDRSVAAEAVPRICLEVNVDPPNPVSVAFHDAHGYITVEELTHPDGHVVALMVKE